MARRQGDTRTASSARHDRYRTNTQDLDWPEERANAEGLNVGDIERLASALVGGGLLVRSIPRLPSLAAGVGTMVGAALLQRGLTGHCAVYNAFDLNTVSRSDTAMLGRRKIRTSRAIKIEESIDVAKPARELFRFWRDLRNWPEVMAHIRSVEPFGDRLSHWVLATAPGGPSLEWDAQIINEVEHSRIAWRTLKGAMIAHAGSVEFMPIAVDDRDITRVTVTLQYEPLGGPVGAALAKALGQDPNRTVAAGLARFKDIMESESTPTPG
ncbi:cyclase [Nitrospira sp.]|nr:cyclase [Nitrospira sp.]